MNDLRQRAEQFPISFFSVVMGMTGLTIAWHKASTFAGVPAWVSEALLLVSAVVFVAMLGMYATKLVISAQNSLSEWQHPVKINFFPSISISLLLLSIAVRHDSAALSEALWGIGTVLHLLFTVHIIGIWMHGNHLHIKHLNPAWFIPAVGNVIVPIAGMSHGYEEISWFFFSIGLVFWMVLMTIVFYRIFFHEPIEQKLLPSMFILIAPPAVGSISYMSMTGEFDAFARVLYDTALFLTLLMLSQIHRFIRLPFFISWWAYSFPLAAMTISSFLVYEHLGKTVYAWIAETLLAVLSVLVLLLASLTINAVWKRKVCVEGH